MFAALSRIVDGRDPADPAADSGAAASAPPRAPSSAGRLSVVDLGMCGRPITAKCAAVFGRIEGLHTLRLGGCFRLSTSAVATMLAQCGGGLVDLMLSANSQIGPEAIEAIGRMMNAPSSESRQMGLRAVLYLARSDAERAAFVDAGIAPVLVRMLYTLQAKIQTDVMRTLLVLAQNQGAPEAKKGCC